MPQGKPNILILMTDQQRADCMGCAGHPQLQTPNMDRIASEGMRFTRAVTNSPLCMPARASFLTGQYVHEHGLWDNKGEVDPDSPTLFRSLQQAGYCTAHVGKAHYYNELTGNMYEHESFIRSLGFDYLHQTTGPWATAEVKGYARDDLEAKGLLEAYREDFRKRREHGTFRAGWASPLSVDDHPDSYIGKQGVRFVEEYEGDGPFCLFVGFGGPHEPWDPPGEYATMYDLAGTPPPIGLEPPEPGSWVPDYAAEWQRAGVKDEMSEDDVRAMRVAYYGKVSLIDRWFGEILAACERRGLMDELLILFWSDHGEMAGDHHRMFKWRFFESSVRVPLVVRWPGRIEPGLTSDALAETVDIMPTLIEAAGAEVPQTCSGKSLWPVLRDQSSKLRDAALSEVATRAGHHRNTMICTERYKYAVHEDGRPYMLYDLAEDPDELNNLIGHPDARGIGQELGRQLGRLSALSR